MSKFEYQETNSYSRFRTNPNSLQRIDTTDMNQESPLKMLHNTCRMSIVTSKAKLQSIALLLFVSSVTGFSAPAGAPPTTLWQIGEFDESSEEFPSRSTGQKVLYTVGQSDPAKDWVGVQRGSGWPSGSIFDKVFLVARAARPLSLEDSASGDQPKGSVA